MILTHHTLSLSEFHANAGQTLARLSRTGEAEILTVDGEARAVLVSPAAYDEMAREALLARDVASIRESMRQHAQGQGRPVREVFAELRAELLQLKAEQEKEPAE